LCACPDRQADGTVYGTSLERVDHALPCGSRAAVAEHAEADGGVPRTPNRTNQGMLSTCAVPSPWPPAHMLSTEGFPQRTVTDAVVADPLVQPYRWAVTVTLTFWPLSAFASR
jgi:hypothetical protein